MKVVSSIKSAKMRHPACQVVRRKGKIYVINKVEPRYKARQGYIPRSTTSASLTLEQARNS